jgi:ribosomal protein S18 acetylase RimI-like enzyme
VDDLKSRGVDRTTISVEGENEAALGLYDAEGFRPHVEWPHWVAPPVAPA